MEEDKLLLLKLKILKRSKDPSWFGIEPRRPLELKTMDETRQSPAGTLSHSLEHKIPHQPGTKSPEVSLVEGQGSVEVVLGEVNTQG